MVSTQSHCSRCIFTIAQVCQQTTRQGEYSELSILYLHISLATKSFHALDGFTCTNTSSLLGRLNILTINTVHLCDISTTSTTSCVQDSASTEVFSMSVAGKSKGKTQDSTSKVPVSSMCTAPTVAFRKRRHKPKRQASIHYRPYLAALIQPTPQSKPVQDDEIEEGEIIEEAAAETNTTNHNSSSSAKTARQEFIRNTQQLRPVDELCPTFCTTGTLTRLGTDEPITSMLTLSQEHVPRSALESMTKVRRPSVLPFCNYNNRARIPCKASVI